ncbi:hypothetical protein GO308_09890 [Sphingomonas sp. SFZ2018-12]|uniref:hypothetical protein n=1 Tax=Sphingomonas sp. SFZ2018-12 TaxID=2683197 RepID=UPI001F0E9EB7|nr:hypothetical protein [Sphingomonas sp. SFZ2018-12]MCH4893419.1 hypothetical protein [Sphingomonas sp. SFZ2018-12]
MTDRPIIFSAPMVRALLAGRKTQTRRLLRNPEYYGCPTGDCPHDRQSECNAAMVALSAKEAGYAAGDRLWVRETWRVAPDACEGWAPDAVPCVGWIDYRAGGEAQVRAPSFSHVLDAFGKRVDADWDCLPDRWRPSIFMPRWASRITLLVDDVRVQRLQDISEADIAAEGVRADPPKLAQTAPGRVNMTPITWSEGQDYTASSAFKRLWNSLHGPGAWAANPWVVALTFRLQLGNIDA